MKNEEGWKLIETGGSDEFDLNAVDNSLSSLADQFYLIVAERARKLELINTGDMISKDNFKKTITNRNGNVYMDMYMKRYSLYLDKGVKGVDYDFNAPDSPYQFKNYGMSEEGRKSILRSVTEGKMKVSDTSKTKYGKVGLEGKSQETPNQAEINEREAKTIIYLIKKYGIKTTNLLTDSVKQWLKESEKDIAEALAEQVKAQIIFK